MFSIISSSADVAKYNGDYYGSGQFPKEGYLFKVVGDNIELEFLNNGECFVSQYVGDNEVLFVSNFGSEILGSDPALYLDDGFDGRNYFSDKVLAAKKRISRHEVVTRLVEHGKSYDMPEEINISGYLNGVFYGRSFSRNKILGVSEGKNVWGVCYVRPEGFRGVYPFEKNHHFYLSENNQLQCYSYSGGKHVFNFPLSEIPSEVLEFDGRTVFQTSKNIISLDESRNVLGSINLPHDKNILYQGHHLLANDDNHIYVIDRETSDVVIYDYSLSERHRVSILKDFSVHFQRVSSELNALNLQCAKENIIGSSYMSFWHPDETLEIESFISDENNYSVERNESDGKSSYEVMIDTDNKHDFFRLCDVIVMDVANKYGEDYCEREEVDRQFGGDIRVLVNSKLFEMEPEWIATIQDRLNHMIKTLGGNMQGGVVSGDKQKYIEVTLIPKT